MDYIIYVAKTKALISFAVTAKLICVFVFAYAKSRFSYDAAHFYVGAQWIAVMKVCLYLGHMIKMTIAPIYDENPSKYFLEPKDPCLIDWYVSFRALRLS